MIINGCGYSSVHAFYPNLSKFFQSRFGFSNVAAGSISSIPYLIASFSVPFLGSISGMLGEAYFELMLFCSIGLILCVHVIYLTMADFAAAESENWLLPVLPLLVFGFGHALFTTI